MDSRSHSLLETVFATTRCVLKHRNEAGHKVYPWCHILSKLGSEILTWRKLDVWKLIRWGGCQTDSNHRSTKGDPRTTGDRRQTVSESPRSRTRLSFPDTHHAGPGVTLEDHEPDLCIAINWWSLCEKFSTAVVLHVLRKLRALKISIRLDVFCQNDSNGYVIETLHMRMLCFSEVTVDVRWLTCFSHSRLSGMIYPRGSLMRGSIADYDGGSVQSKTRPRTCGVGFRVKGLHCLMENIFTNHANHLI